MDKNPYDNSVEWTNFYSQPTENVRPYEAAYLHPSYQQEKIRPMPAVKRLSKQEALERAQTLKGYIVLATLLGFGTLGGLIASQIVATNTITLPGQFQGPPTVHDPYGPVYNSGPSDSGSGSGSGGFFNQQGPGQGQGGYGFGQGNNNSGPISGSHTS
jgi:hypothetical protein